MLIGNTYEFLRLSYNSDKTIYGYPNRSYPNLVLTDFQNEEMDKIDPN